MYSVTSSYGSSSVDEFPLKQSLL
ncbi:unnamed protein product, partial [Rotaria sordida]